MINSTLYKHIKKGLIKLMSKKKKQKKNKNVLPSEYLSFSKKEKKSADKDFKRALTDIEIMRMELYEADKKANKKERKKINKKQSEFYTSIESIKCRQKMAKRWEKEGWLDKMIRMLYTASPYIKLLAKGLCMLILSFLSLDIVREKIKVETLDKLTTLFDIAISI